MNEIKVTEIRHGFEGSGKNVESIITLAEKESKLTLHFYNTSFTVKIDGKTAVSFFKIHCLPSYQKPFWIKET